MRPRKRHDLRARSFVAETNGKDGEVDVFHLPNNGSLEGAFNGSAIRVALRHQKLYTTIDNGIIAKKIQQPLLLLNFYTAWSKMRTWKLKENLQCLRVAEGVPYVMGPNLMR